MARNRFVLRYRGEGPKPEADVAKVAGLADVDVVEDSPKMLLVEGEHQPLQQVVDGLPDWEIHADRTYEVPDTRKKVVDPPD
jgi:hypothetical protein